jgi:carbamoylphosphate synthase large subunit
VSTAQKRVLLLSAGSLVGQNIIAALQGRRANLRLIACNSDAQAPLLDECDDVWLLPPHANGATHYTRRLLEILDACKPDLVIPCRDEDTLHIAMLRDDGALGTTRALCGERSLAHAMLDKFESYRISLALGLPFAATVRSNCADVELSRFVAQHGFPLIAKPVRGFASRGVHLVFDDTQLKHWRDRSDYVFQEYLASREEAREMIASEFLQGARLFRSFEATKVSLQIRVTSEGEIGDVFCAEHLMRTGYSDQVTPLIDANVVVLAKQCGSAFAARGWRGPLNVQCHRNVAGELRIYEFNGRFTGATSARLLLGFDEVGDTLRDWLSIKVAASSTRATCVVRIPLSTTSNTTLVRALVKDGHWVRGK